METDSVQLPDITFSYRVIRSKRRTKSISIKIDNLGITVRVPQYTNSADIKELLIRKSPWISKRLNRIQQLLSTAPTPLHFTESEFITYLGKQYPIKRTLSLTSLQFQEGSFVLPMDLERDIVHQQLTDWYIQQAKVFIPTRVEIYAQSFGLPVPKILIRNQKKRWGSCNYKGELRFNWRIIIAPLELLDYVVAHELCHLEHFNHSPAFWQRLQEIMPDCQIRRKELAAKGILFQL